MPPILLIVSSRHNSVDLAEATRMTLPSLDYYAIEELLTEDERAARDRARRFVRDEVMPEIVVLERAPQSCN